MKFLTILTIVLSFFAIESKAGSDSLLITLKNGKRDTISFSNLKKIVFENITSVNETPPSKNTLLQLDGNRPNPFSEQTSLEFELSSQGTVIIVIYDNTGKQIQTLTCENCPSGNHSIVWDGKDKTNANVQTGMYFYEVRYGNEVQSKKMIHIK